LARRTSGDFVVAGRQQRFASAALADLLPGTVATEVKNKFSRHARRGRYPESAKLAERRFPSQRIAFRMHQDRFLLHSSAMVETDAIVEKESDLIGRGE